MKSSQLPPDFVARCKAVTAKRPRTVIEHILTHGHVTTEELRDLYGYNHPPRAARDVREQGIPLETFRVVGSDGRKIGAYRFGDITRARFSRLSGRTALSKTLKAGSRFQVPGKRRGTQRNAEERGEARRKKEGFFLCVSLRFSASLRVPLTPLFAGGARRRPERPGPARRRRYPRRRGPFPVGLSVGWAWASAWPAARWSSP